MQKSRNSKIFLLLYLALIAAMGPLLTDFYLPALPSMIGAFNASTTQIQLTITCFLVGLAFGQLIMGPLSDRYGRKPILALSLGAFVVATFGCVFAKSIEVFIIFRLIQGFAGSGGVVISRSIVADLFRGDELAKFFALLGAIHGLAPIIAPILGGIMLKFSDYHGIFIALLFIGILMFVANLFFKESLGADSATKSAPSHAKPSFWQSFAYFHILKNRAFMACALTQSFCVGVIFSFISSSSFIFQEYFKLSEFAYSLLFAGVAFGAMLGSLLSPLFKSRKRALSVGIMGLGIMGAVLFLLLNLRVHFLLLEAGFFLAMLSLGFILPTSTALAMEMERKNAGSASAILGFGVFFVGGAVSPLTGLGGDIFTSTSLVVALCVLLSVIFGIKVIRLAK